MTAAAIKDDDPKIILQNWTAERLKCQHMDLQLLGKGTYATYMPARGQFSLNLRTKLSNFSDVGQMRMSSGISTKMSTTPVTLH